MTRWREPLVITERVDDGPIRVVVRAFGEKLSSQDALDLAWPEAVKVKGWPLRLRRIPGYVVPVSNVFEHYFIEEAEA